MISKYPRNHWKTYFSPLRILSIGLYKKKYRLLLLYSSINQEVEMETLHLSSFLDGIQKTFNRNHSKISAASRITPCETAPINTKSEFSQSIEKKIHIVRSKITEAMEKAGKVADGECLTSI